MNAAQLRDALAAYPDHWPVVVSSEIGTPGVRVQFEFSKVQDTERENLGSLGNCVVIITEP